MSYVQCPQRKDDDVQQHRPSGIDRRQSACVCGVYQRPMEYDVIVVGAFTVLICGQPAARMGDSTAHGGVIVLGYPTVLIG